MTAQRDFGMEAEFDETTNVDASQQQSKSKRYLVFIGNLAYKTTKADLEKFLKDTYPISIRLLTNKETGKPKGFAFAEFDNPQSLHMALDLHHTQLLGRTVNVELTVGGGGSKSANRKRKIKEKNANFAAERAQQQQQPQQDAQK